MSPNNKKHNFDGKVAIVTGSSSGIGAAIAIQLAQYGAQVTITGRDAANLDKVAQQILLVSNGVKPLQLVGSLSDDDSFPRKLINETVAEFGGLDYLINNAATNTPYGALESPKLLEGFDSVFKLNVRVPIELTQLAVPHLEKTQGNIINISSALSLKPGKLVYASSKAALDMVTKTSALELGPKGIRVNSINPGLVVTPFARTVGWSQEEIDKFYSDKSETSLIKRVGQPEDIANLASFLVSEDAKNITGSIYLSDSGWMLKDLLKDALNIPTQICDHSEFPTKLVNETIAKFGRLDILVNSAGGGVKQNSLASPTLLQDFDNVLKLNVRAVVELTQLAVPHLKKTKGNVINISSGAAILPKIIIYCSTKAALDMVTKTSALELGPKGIRLNSINSDPVVTSIGRDLGFTDEEFAKVWDEIGEKSLLGRVGQPVDIANLASFLASDDARNITGSINVCDGGLLIGGGGNVKFRKDE